MFLDYLIWFYYELYDIHYFEFCINYLVSMWFIYLWWYMLIIWWWFGLWISRKGFVLIVDINCFLDRVFYQIYKWNSTKFSLDFYVLVKFYFREYSVFNHPFLKWVLGIICALRVLGKCFEKLRPIQGHAVVAICSTFGSGRDMWHEYQMPQHDLWCDKFQRASCCNMVTWCCNMEGCSYVLSNSNSIHAAAWR